MGQAADRRPCVERAGMPVGPPATPSRQRNDARAFGDRLGGDKLEARRTAVIPGTIRARRAGVRQPARSAHARRGSGIRSGGSGRLGACLAAIVLAFAPTVPAAATEPPLVAVAASLRIAMPDLVAAFERASGRRVRVAYAASGVLTRQIRRGAPFELFLAANAEYPAILVRAGLTAGEPVAYALGRIGLFAPHDSPLDVSRGMRGLEAALAAGTIERFAVPNPRHAPYGLRARQALEHAGLWGSIEPLLVLGENAAQAAQFAASGSSQGGIVPASLGTAPRFAQRGRFAPIPAARHAPLAQRMVLLRGAGPTARAFHHFLQQTAARAILAEHGFSLPAADAVAAP